VHTVLPGNRIKFGAANTEVAMGQVRPVAPEQNDEVLIMHGEGKGQSGRLISIQAGGEDGSGNPTGVVTLQQDEMFLPALSQLVKFSRQ